MWIVLSAPACNEAAGPNFIFDMGRSMVGNYVNSFMFLTVRENFGGGAPSHRYHWHVATPAVSAKKGPTSHASLRLLFSGRTHTATPRHQGDPRVKLLTKGGPAPCITAAACLPSRCCWAPNSEGPAPRRAGGPGEGTNIVETSA